MRRMVMWLLILLFPLAGLAEDVLFSEGVPHASHLDYRQYFETRSAKIGACTLAIEQTFFDAEKASALYAQVAADEAALAEMAPMQAHTVYVVEKPLAGLQRIGTAIYCSAAQVLDGSYRPILAEAAFGVETWRAVGLAGYAFGVTADTSALSAWYADNAHDDMLSLFQAYFVPEFAAEDELRMACQTAMALTAYIIREAGLEAALAADAAAYIPDWLAFLGIDRAYVDPYAGLLDGYTWTRNQFYPLIGMSPKGDVFKLKPLEYDMTTAAQVHMALADLELGVDAILEGVRQHAPDWYDRLAKNLEAPITYEFRESKNYTSVAHTEARRIDVATAGVLIHETMHIMTPCVYERISRYMDTWKAEAITEYLTKAYYNGDMEQTEIFTYMQDNYIDAHELPEMREFYRQARMIYQEYAPLPENYQDVNLNLYCRAMTLTDMGLNSVVDVYVGADANSASLDAVNGNELSYTESEWLASYLINRHGLSAFLHYCMDEGVSFEDAFGLSYEAAKADWLANRTLLD